MNSQGKTRRRRSKNKRGERSRCTSHRVESYAWTVRYFGAVTKIMIMVLVKSYLDFMIVDEILCRGDERGRLLLLSSIPADQHQRRTHNE